MDTSNIKALTRDQIVEAFEKTRAETNVPGVRLGLITEEHYEKALQFAREEFVPNEPIYKGIGVEWDQALEDIWLEKLRFNLSLMFVDENTDEIIAFRSIRIASIDDTVDLNSIRSQKTRDLIHYGVHCDEMANFFEHYGITEAFHFLGLAVKKNYQGRGYATAIFKAAIKMVRHFGFDQVYIKGEASSNYSKRIYEKAGFQSLWDIPYETWTVDGRRPIQNIGEHKSQTVYGLKVTQHY